MTVGTKNILTNILNIRDISKITRGNVGRIVMIK